MKRSYKYLRIIAVIAFFLGVEKSFAIEKESYLEFNGTVKQFLYDGKLSEVIVDSAKFSILSIDNIVLNTFYSTSAGKCYFKIPLFENVIIKVTKENYVSKTITVNSWIPDLNNSRYSIKYDIYLFENVEGVDVSVLKKPIADVVYVNTLNTFNYDRVYSDSVNENLRSVYSNYYQDLVKNNSYSKVRLNSYKKSLETKLLSDSIIASLNVPIPSKIVSPEIEFEVQVLALKGPLPIDAALFENCENISCQFVDGFYKYRLKRVSKYEEAKQLLDKMVQQGFIDAFIIALKNNEQVSVRAAIDMKAGR